MDVGVFVHTLSFTLSLRYHSSKCGFVYSTICKVVDGKPKKRKLFFSVFLHINMAVNFQHPMMMMTMIKCICTPIGWAENTFTVYNQKEPENLFAACAFFPRTIYCFVCSMAWILCI